MVFNWIALVRAELWPSVFGHQCPKLLNLSVGEFETLKYSDNTGPLQWSWKFIAVSKPHGGEWVIARGETGSVTSSKMAADRKSINHSCAIHHAAIGEETQSTERRCVCVFRPRWRVHYPCMVTDHFVGQLEQSARCVCVSVCFFWHRIIVSMRHASCRLRFGINFNKRA